MEHWLERLPDRAAQTLPTAVYRYFAQGARDGVSAAEAQAAWDRYRLLPQVLRDVTEVDLRTSLLGTVIGSPVAVAPTTLQRLAHPDGEAATARAVAASDGLLCLSSNAGTRFEDIAATGAPWWLQMYLTADRLASLPVLQRARDCGARAVVLTADTPMVGTKDDTGQETVWDLLGPGHLRVNFDGPAEESPALEKARDLGPQDIEWLHDVVGLPVVVKGVLRSDDARRCVDAGAAAIWVSNHGGRQLDYAASTADSLSAVVAQVGDQAEVYVDGGLRRGRHVLSALALGARAVFLGRPVLFALAAGGEPWVRRLLADVGAELAEAMMLAGCADADEVPRSLVTRAPTVADLELPRCDSSHAPRV